MKLAPHDYAGQGPLSEPGRHAGGLARLASELPTLCAQLQGLLIHYFWLESYGDEVPRAFDPPRRLGDVQRRSVPEILDGVLRFSDAPLDQPRQPARRLAATCRHFTLLLVSALRQKGVPARARCGFAGYFVPGEWIDHWIAEVWDAAAGRWQQVDAQLDAVQRGALQIGFDPLDMPAGAFLNAGQAWQACVRGDADPARFGILDMHGWGFIEGNVVRDLLALDRVEVLPWDGGWGLLAGDRLHRAAPPADDPVHALAAASARGEASAAQHEGVRLPEGWDFSQAPTLAQLMGQASA
ncbi:MAG TPA: transglutaminase domain-containing protein [Albitalea sp.]